MHVVAAHTRLSFEDTIATVAGAISCFSVNRAVLAAVDISGGSQVVLILR